MILKYKISHDLKYIIISDDIKIYNDINIDDNVRL